MSGEPALAALPGPPKLVNPGERAPRDPGAWGYYTKAGPYRRAMWCYRFAFALAVFVDFGPLLVLLSLGVRKATKATWRRLWSVKAPGASSAVP